MAWYTSRGQRLHYEDLGEGPPVLLLHGFTNYGGAWGPQVMDLLYAGYRVLLPDFAGHGLSQPAAQVTRVEDLAADAAALLDHLGVARAHVCGLSLGGMVAQRLAVSHAGRVASLVVADSQLRFDTPAAQEAVAFWVSLLEQPQGPLLRLERTWPNLVSEAFRASAAGAACYESWQRVNARVQGWSLINVARGMLSFRVSEELGTVRAPTLVLTGADDRLIPPAEAHAIAAAVAGARCEEIPGAGHISNLDAPAAFSRLLLDFLATAAGSGGAHR